LREKTKNVVLWSIEKGVTLIDTAQAQEWYSEKELGFCIILILLLQL
jgi:diketogulonate reductase-like aldo/keto reductase